MKYRSSIGVVAILAALLCAGVLPATAQNAPSSKKTKMTPDDIIYTQAASQFEVSPDGKWVVWVKSVPNKEKDTRTSNLMLSSLTADKEIELTRGDDNVGAPRWSPDGAKIAFMTSRALPKEKQKPDVAHMQLWMIDPAGGEAWPVTALARGIHEFEWNGNDTIVYSAEEEPTLYEEEMKKKKDDSNVVDDETHAPPVRLFSLDVKTAKATRITSNNDRIETFDVSRDGKSAVTIDNRELSYGWDFKTPPVVNLVDVSSGKSRQILTDHKILPGMARWALDNSGFYFVAPFTHDPRFYEATIDKIYFYDPSNDRITPVDLGWENGMGFGFDVTNDGFLALLADGARFKPARYARHGNSWSHEWLAGEHVAQMFDISTNDDGKAFVYEHSTPSEQPQWYRARLDGAHITDVAQLTHLNPQLKDKATAKGEVVQWKGANNDTVEGILYYPANYQAGKKYPLVLAIHGGPTGVDMDGWSQSWAYPSDLFAQKGAFVLQPNYHGSGNYGLAWAESICCGKYYSLDIEDIEKGVDSLISKGLVDPDRIGTMGWSNGAILSIKLTTVDPARYKVAAPGAGEVEWISDWANVDFGQAFDTYYFGKSMPEDPELYLKMSPLLDLGKVRAPTIIFQGTDDRNVPTDEGWTYYRTLYYFDKAPVRFVLFPGEPHGPRKLSHQLRKVTEEQKWFDKYFFKTAPPENEALKEGSPLDYALRLHSMKRSGGLYGDTVNDALVPEAVKRGDLEIGRFEVTRAQYAEFDKSYHYDSGAGNYPANGITLDQAKAYCNWLTKTTGETYRLPYEDEVTALFKKNEEHADENTLDYWAGYKLNPDDAQRLEEKIKEVPGGAPLLKPVGSFAPEGDKDEELIFDLGGNVAEWVLKRDGSGVAMGASADRPADPEARYDAAVPAYTGLRVVRGAPQPTAESKPGRR